LIVQKLFSDLYPAKILDLSAKLVSLQRRQLNRRGYFHLPELFVARNLRNLETGALFFVINTYSGNWIQSAL